MNNQAKQKIEWSSKAFRELRKIDTRYQQAIIQKVEQLVHFPKVNLDIKHLNDSTYRLRHGDYRVFFEWIEGIPKIIKIQSVRRRTNQTYRN